MAFLNPVSQSIYIPSVTCTRVVIFIAYFHVLDLLVEVKEGTLGYRKNLV